MILLDLQDAARIARQNADIAALKQQRPRTGTRAYQAGVANRLTNDWITAPTATRSELRMYLRNIRARSRDLARNNDYFKKFLQMCKTNIVGPHGIRLQVRAKSSDDPVAAELDRTLNSYVEAQFKRWANKRTASASGKLSWADAQRLFVQTLARDGEVLVRKRWVRKTKANPFGFSLQFIDVNWLDEAHNADLRDGRRIIMGVEVDANDRPLAYHLTPPVEEFTYPGAMSGNQGRQRTRVPADEIIHAYLVDDENQTRGLPWAHTAMFRTKMLGGYEEAELVAARAGACKTGLLKPNDDAPYDGEEEDTVIESVEPGMVQQLPRGFDWIDYDPSHPNTNYAEFVRGVLRGIAAGLGVSYTSLTGDLSQVNFSSIRAGLLEERDVWRTLQQFTIEHFCQPVFEAWAEAAWLTGALELAAEDYERILTPAWQPRGWPWVDPLKDINATILAVNNGLATRTDALAEQGVDFEETVLTLAQENQLLAENGVEIVTSVTQDKTADKSTEAEE